MRTVLTTRTHMRATVRTRALIRPQGGRRRGRYVAGALALLVVLGVTAACSSSSKKASGASSSSLAGSSASGSQPVKDGGSITILSSGVSATLDPALNQTYSFSDGPMMSAIYGNLAYLDPQTGALNYYLLKTMTPNADFTVWKMTLNPGIKFSDGTPLDASAIMFNYQRIADPATASYYGPLARQFQMQVLDDLDLQITLPAPNAYLPENIAEDLPAIGSPTAIKTEGKDFATHPVGAGPFKIESIVANDTIVVVRNPDYYVKGEPHLDKITFQTLSDITQQQSALQSGQVQMVAATGGGANDQLKKTPNTIYYGVHTGAGQDLLMNNTAPPFNDPDAREALTLALDRSAAADAFAAGTPAATNLFPSNSPFYDKKYDWPATDTARAQTLFDKLAAEGKPVDFTYETIASPLQAPMSNYLIAALAKFKNVKITVKAVPLAQYGLDQRNGKYQLIPHGLYEIPPVPDITEYFKSTGVLNTFHWSNATVDAAIATILKTPPTDTATLKTQWATVLQQFLADDPIYFAGQGVLGLIYTPNLVNVIPMNYGNYVLWGKIGYKA